MTGGNLSIDKGETGKEREVPFVSTSAPLGPEERDLCSPSVKHGSYFTPQSTEDEGSILRRIKTEWKLLLCRNKDPPKILLLEHAQLCEHPRVVTRVEKKKGPEPQGK